MIEIGEIRMNKLSELKIWLIQKELYEIDENALYGILEFFINQEDGTLQEVFEELGELS